MVHSGLGNQLFQFAAVYAFAKKSNAKFGMNRTIYIQSSHTTLNYMDTIFKKVLARYETSLIPQNALYQGDNPYTDEQLIAVIRSTNTVNEPIIGLNGYFQNESTFRGYRNEIFSLLDWGNSPAIVAERYGDLTNGFFLHFRRGDYVGTSFWKDLDEYYKYVIKRVLEHEPNTRFYIVSDEIEYCKENMPYLSEAGLNCIFVDGLTEIDTMWLMSKCPLGGAAPNSTFSWWGLYLNPTRPFMFIPDCYDPEHYGFPGATIVVLDT